MHRYIFFVIILLFFTSCLKKNTSPINKKIRSNTYFLFNSNTYDSIDSAINEIANQLLINIKNSDRKNYKIAITSFVDIDNFSKTSTLGRALGESLIDELHIRKFKILDYRAQDIIIVNKNGEFSLTREAERLSDEIPESLILVGTYTKLSKNKILINARILDVTTLDVLSTAKVNLVIKSCHLINSCPKNIGPIINYIPIKEDK